MYNKITFSGKIKIELICYVFFSGASARIRVMTSPYGLRDHTYFRYTTLGRTSLDE
jgi:hypothetical protein